jgi:hypothetical protein
MPQSKPEPGKLGHYRQHRFTEFILNRLYTR